MKRKRRGRIALLVVSLVLSIGIAASALLARFGPAGQPLREEDIVELTATVIYVRLPDPSVGEAGAVCTLEYGEKMNLAKTFDLAPAQVWEALQPGDTIVFGVWSWMADKADQLEFLIVETVRTENRSIVSLETRNTAARQHLDKLVWFGMLASAAVMALAIYSAASLVREHKTERQKDPSEIIRDSLKVTYRMDLSHLTKFYRSVILSSTAFSITVVVLGMIFLSLFFADKRIDVLIWAGCLLLLCFFLVSKVAVKRAARIQLSALVEAGAEQAELRTVCFADALCFAHGSQITRFEYCDIVRCICGRDVLIVRTKAGRYGYIPIETDRSGSRLRMLTRLRAENPHIVFSNERRGIWTVVLVLVVFLLLTLIVYFYSF